MSLSHESSLASRASRIECPTCGARDGERCISQRTGRPVAFNPHPARIDRVRPEPREIPSLAYSPRSPLRG